MLPQTPILHYAFSAMRLERNHQEDRVADSTKEMTARKAGSAEGEFSDGQEGKYLTFLIGDECYGLDIRHVTEIIGMQKITSVPDVPDYLKGVINLRGKVIPVMDVRLRFSMPAR